VPKNARPTSTLTSTPIPKLRRVSRRKRTSGFCTVSSMATKPVRNTAATIASRKMKDEANQSSLLPSSSTVWSADRPIAMVTMPVQAPSFSKESCIGSRSSVKASATTITALGAALTKKIVCQP
jgi:hypothetical protein